MAQNTDAIDMTPTWASLLPVFVAAIQDGTDKGRDAAKAELKRMAHAADLWNAHCKAERSKVWNPSD